MVLLAVTRPAGLGLTAGQDIQFPDVSVATYGPGDGSTIGDLVADFAAAPNVLTDPYHAPGDQALGYLLAAGIEVDGRWSIDLSGHPVAGDQLALTLLAQGIMFERSSDNAELIGGPGALPSWDYDDPAAVIAGSAYLSGTRGGRLARGRATQRIQPIVSELGLVTEVRPDATGTTDEPELWVVGLSSLRRLAALSYRCGTDVALRGPADCADGTAGAHVSEAWAWRVATTGALQPDAPVFPATEDGGIGWTNREAQAYRPNRVRFDGESIELDAVANPTPSTLALPYSAGMVMSTEELGFGRLDVTARLPVGDGLWPAIWLLDAQACEAPGRCSAYATTNYHEIDVVEMAGSAANELHTSVHWFDERVQSLTAVTELAVAGDGMAHVYSLIRRPGLLIWLIDDVEVFRVVGEASADRGPHRSAPMYLIANLAVGGTFAGDRILGPTSQWWGDAKVPANFPNLGWTEATLGIDSVRFAPLGS